MTLLQHTAGCHSRSHQLCFVHLCVHCFAGGGRTGLVQAAWLVSSKGMSPQQAAEAVTAYAASKSLSRRVDLEALQAFLQRAGVQQQ